MVLHVLYILSTLLFLYCALQAHIRCKCFIILFHITYDVSGKVLSVRLEDAGCMPVWILASHRLLHKVLKKQHFWFQTIPGRWKMVHICWWWEIYELYAIKWGIIYKSYERWIRLKSLCIPPVNTVQHSAFKITLLSHQRN